jgi:hypothetical protein
MKFVKSLLMGTGSVVLAGLVLTLVAPKAVHSAVATLVQVANTTAAPAITQDTSNQASQIITLFCEYSNFPQEVCAQVAANSVINLASQYYVPAGQNLVITSIDFNGPTGATQIALNSINATGCSFPCLSGTYETWTVNGQQVTINLSRGIVVGPTIGPLITTPSSQSIVWLHGYLTAN